MTIRTSPGRKPRSRRAASPPNWPGAAFDSHGACFVEPGDQRAAFATGNFYAPGSNWRDDSEPIRHTQ